VLAGTAHDDDMLGRLVGEAGVVRDAFERLPILLAAQDGGRASTAWFVLEYLLGHEHALVCDGSWAEWGKMPATPVECG
jgi:3-mercaptopyruvate sulfurtransferase SseA